MTTRTWPQGIKGRVRNADERQNKRDQDPDSASELAAGAGGQEMLLRWPGGFRTQTGWPAAHDATT